MLGFILKHLILWLSQFQQKATSTYYYAHACTCTCLEKKLTRNVVVLSFCITLFPSFPPSLPLVSSQAACGGASGL